MFEYRLFFFDRLGRLLHAHEFEAADEKAATRIAESWREGRGMELWQHDTKVRTWEAD
jgi:hypothetical protein